MDTRKRSTLKQTYYRSFWLLIVIPLILVFAASEFVVSYILRSSALETIDALQNNIATALSRDVRSNSLQLSHFVHNNDGEFLQSAIQAHHSSGSSWYQADQQLQQAFRTAIVPSHDILAGGFYMRERGAVYMKDDIIVPQEEVRASGWYRQAVNTPNRTVLGCYDTSRTRLTHSTQKGNQLVLVTAMATDYTTDRSGEIEVVSFFTVSQAGDVLLSQRKDSAQGRSVLLDSEGRVLFGDFGSEPLRAYFEQNAFETGSQTRRAALEDGTRRTYLFRVKAIPDTSWRVVTFVEERQLGRAFYRLGGILALIVAGLLTLFYFYSRYFLNAIIAPVHTVCQGMARLDSSDLSVQVEPTGQREIQELMVSFNQMVLGIKNMLQLTEDTMQRRHEMEIQALQSQINPHFIVNTLNSIRFMAQVAGFDGIRKMTESLVSIVSCSFRSSTSFYTVREELEMLKTYIYLMRIRYSNGFEVSYQIDPDCLEYRLPRLTLQPVVENAITHGFDELSEDLGQLEIRVFRQDGSLCLSVWDNGRGIPPGKAEELLRGHPRRHDDNTSIGLENVQARLRLHFGEAARMEIESEPGQFTRITFRLPLSACKRLEKQEEAHDSDTDCR